MNINTQLRRTAATGSIVLALGALTTLPAAASHDGGGREIEHRGSCSHNANWKLRAKADNGRIEVQAEIDSNVNGQVWSWRILHNGGVSARGKSTTQAPSGSFEVRRLLVNAPGTDAIGLRASNGATGETCTGGLRF
jgi:hypothetical protein